MKSILPTLALAAVLPITLAGCVVVDSQGHITREEKRFTVEGTPELRLVTFDGAIEIRAGDGKTVVVEIEKRGPTKESTEELRVEAKQEGDRIEVEVKKPAHEVVVFGVGVGRMSTTAKLIVTMPRDGNVTARSGDGSIRIEHVHGRLELKTGDGSIRATDIAGQLTLSTGDGSVTLEDVGGDLDVDTGDGSVSVAGKLATVKLHTGDGSITFRAAAGTSMKEDWSMTTGDGGIALYLPSDFGAELDAHTGDGSIRNELGVKAEAEADSDRDRDRERDRRTLKGKLGAGGKLLRIRTGDGSIRLKTS
jgi:Putative adhesin